MKVYILLKNADFTEGRGPMLFHKAFVTESKMIEYINTLTGIFGAKPPKGVNFYNWMRSGKTGGWSGYEIKELDVE